MVMCKEPEMREPFSGFLPAYSLRSDIRPGISISASSISLRPKRTVSADKSLTKKGGFAVSERFVFMKLVIFTGADAVVVT